MQQSGSDQPLLEQFVTYGLSVSSPWTSASPCGRPSRSSTRWACAFELSACRSRLMATLISDRHRQCRWASRRRSSRTPGSIICVRRVRNRRDRHAQSFWLGILIDPRHPANHRRGGPASRGCRPSATCRYGKIPRRQPARSLLWPALGDGVSLLGGRNADDAAQRCWRCCGRTMSGRHAPKA